MSSEDMFKTPPAKSEYVTRKAIVDRRLRDAGWKIVRFDESKSLGAYEKCAIEEFPTENGPADYALCVGGKILGIVEAKKLTLGPQNVLMQAERYSKGLLDSPFDFRGFRVPFLYSTNGEVIWHHDVRHELNRSREVQGFHTPDALIECFARDFEGALAKLAILPNDHARIVARPYQVEANTAIEKAIEARKRQMLLAMATGTGKTFMTVNEVYRLMKSGVAKRILFLVDRRALAAQAVRTFASFEPETGHKFNQLYHVYSQKFHRDDFGEDEKFDPTVLPSSYLLAPKAGDAFVYVCTIQRMAINLFGREVVLGDTEEAVDEDAEELKNIPIHAFDLVIADECHRGYTATQFAIWRKTLEHFDAINMGLTATPASHTTTYFKDIVYRYEYERAVREGYLVDYDVVAVKSDVRMKGIFLKEGEEVAYVDQDSGVKQLDLLEDERAYDTTDIEQKVTSPDSNRKILEELKKYALLHEARYGRFPKTLIFAANDLSHTSHADQLVDTARDVFGRGEEFVRKITGRVDRPLQWIRKFRNLRTPAVACATNDEKVGERVHPEGPAEAVGDKGYHSNGTLTALADAEVRTYISEPDRGQRNWKDKPKAQAAVYGNRRRIRGEHGKELLRRRGELVERSFAHAYETGGMRRVHLRGRENILKRVLIHLGGFNLSLVMRQLLGKGTPRGLQGLSADALLAFLRLWIAVLMCTEREGISLPMPVS